MGIGFSERYALDDYVQERRGSDCEALRIRLWVYLISEAKNLGLYVAAESRVGLRSSHALSAS